jgi:arylsulfatase
MQQTTPLTRRHFLRTSGAGVLTLFAGSLLARANETRPNLVFILADDVSPNDLGCYGNGGIQTPHLDRIAREGLRFENAYTVTSSCSPSRCSMITGRYPHNHGAPELHKGLPLDQVTFPQLLHDAGYHTVLSGKNHMGDVRRAFDVISKGKGPGKEGDWVDLLRERPKDKPFFCWFASTDAHRPWQFNEDAPRYGPETAAVPPYLFDGPMTRQDLASYYHEISRLDHYVGAVLAELETQGILDNTWLVFCSDNGRPFPRCKTRLYDSGVEMPLLVYAPGRVNPGTAAGLVSTIDLAPTFLELAGVAVPETVQGVGFRAVLEDPKATVRDIVFTEHNWHVFQVHERMVRRENWVYIRNAWPERQNLCVESTAEYPAGEELWAAEARGDLQPHQRDIFTVPRAAEELYDINTDPHQINNLADNLDHAETLARMRGLLDQWTEETGDTIPEQPTGDRQDKHGTKNPDFKVNEFPGAARNAVKINRPGPVREERTAKSS